MRYLLVSELNDIVGCPNHQPITTPHTRSLEQVSSLLPGVFSLYAVLFFRVQLTLFLQVSWIAFQNDLFLHCRSIVVVSVIYNSVRTEYGIPGMGIHFHYIGLPFSLKGR